MRAISFPKLEAMSLHRAFLLVFWGFVGLLVACSAPVVPDTREADIKGVKELEAAWVRDIATKDAEKVASYFAAEGSMLFPNAPIISGRSNIQAAWKMFLSDPNFALTFQSTKADASKSGDLVYTVGTYSMTMTNPKDNKPITDQGKYLTVFNKQADGNWKVVADMANSDLPLSGAGK